MTIAAVMSVILTNQVLGDPAASAYTAVTLGVVPAEQVPPMSSHRDTPRWPTPSMAPGVGADCSVHRSGPVLPRKKIDRLVEPEQEKELAVPAVMH